MDIQNNNQVKSIFRLEAVCKSFKVGTQEIPVLKNISFEITNGDFVIIFGPSGSGKSTLLHILLGLEYPSSGLVNFLEQDLYTNATEDHLSVIRKKHVGMIYQQSNWIKSLNVIENVGFPLTLLGYEKSQALNLAMRALRMVGMNEWAGYYPGELSGGQQQRVGFARALVNSPQVIIADEPTGNLDFESGQTVMKLLTDLNANQGKTIIMVTHDLEYIRYCKTALQIFDGELVGVFSGKDKEKLQTTLRSKRGVADPTKVNNQ